MANTAAYGITNTVKDNGGKWTWKSGIPCSVVNTKLGTDLLMPPPPPPTPPHQRHP
ncbi:hypothetical protein DPMN_127448 [Dreissena polymorpha]|uniref:Uncharacterized protein n=1 Tax=Dreissena polymorpha TaxID=45954 RepID=A0A9D4H192_DREPO|nr:hypothetical protein DPMN_127448 [Dreissena polymorpha]